MVKLIIVSLLVPFLFACIDVNQIREDGADAMDVVVQGAENVICRDASVGAIKRKFNTKEKAQLWTELCKENSGWTP